MTVTSNTIGTTGFLPPKVVEVARETIRNFQHSKKVGNYLLGTTIGEGSFAKVKEALHIPTGEKVAVKVIDKKKVKEDSYVRKNLRREGKILQMVRHPNVVQLYEIMETENSYYLVTELCKGGDLMDFICMKKKLEERDTKRYIRQIVCALEYIHRLGILHRDLKVENLLLDENRDIKIIDFGLSNCIKIATTKDGVRAQEHLVTQCGSPAYAAPELLGRKKYGPQVDIWSIGINMYAMLTGNLPFTVDPFNIKTLHHKMITGQMNPMPDYISKDCRDLLKKFLNPDPDKRISLTEAMRHPWIAESRCSPLEPSPCPNKLKTEDLDETIMKHMVETQGFRMSEIIRFVTGNVPSPATAMYHIVHGKLTKYMADLRVQGKIPAVEPRLFESSKVTCIFHHSRLGGSQNRTPSQRHYTSHHVPFTAKPNGQNKIITTNKYNVYKSHRKISTKPAKVNKDVEVTELTEDRKDEKENITREAAVLEFTNLDFSEQVDTPIKNENVKFGESNKNYVKQLVQLVTDKSQKYAVENASEKENEKDSGFDSEVSESPRKIFKRTRNRPYLSLQGDYNINSQSPSHGTQKLMSDQLEITSNRTDNIVHRSPNKPQIQSHRFTTNNKITENSGDNTMNGYIRSADIKMTDGGKILGLSFLPSSKIQNRRFIQNGARFSFDRKKVISRPKMKHYISMKTESDEENAVLPLPTETVSPLSSLSKQVSSRATTHSMRSVSTKDSHIALPCISPTNIHRNQ